MLLQGGHRACSGDEKLAAAKIQVKNTMTSNRMVPNAIDSPSERLNRMQP